MAITLRDVGSQVKTPAIPSMIILSYQLNNEGTEFQYLCEYTDLDGVTQQRYFKNSDLQEVV